MFVILSRLSIRDTWAYLEPSQTSTKHSNVASVASGHVFNGCRELIFIQKYSTKKDRVLEMFPNIIYLDGYLCFY